MKITKEDLQKIVQEEFEKEIQEQQLTEKQVEEIFGGKLRSKANTAYNTVKDKLLGKKPTAPATQTTRSQPQIARFTQGPSSDPTQSQATTSSTVPSASGVATQTAGPGETATTATTQPATEQPAAPPAPAAIQPETPPAAAQQAPAAAKDPVTDSTADIVMPHAVVLKGLLTRQIAQSLQKVLGGLPQDQRKTVMGPVMQYINNLPGMASKVIAEEMTPQQQDLKAKLAAKHAGNISLIGKNLQALEGEIMNSIKSQLNADNVAEILYSAIEKTHGKSKQGDQYMKSLLKNPQGHLNSLLQNAQLVVKNIMSLVQKNMPKAPAGQSKLGAPQQPGANTAAMAKKQAAAKPVAPTQKPAPVAESYKVTYDKWQKIIKG